MKEITLRRHGEKINPIYATADSASSFGNSTDTERADGQASGVVKSYKKGEVACPDVTALGLIKGRYPNAIEYIGIAVHVRGLVIFMSVFVAAISIFFGQLSLLDLLADGLVRTSDKVFAFVSCVFIAVGVLFVVFGVRHEFFRPEDEPIIFDRKQRKVYRLFREVHPGLFGLFRPWPLHAAEYDWDLIDAEHTAVLTTTGSSVMRYHHLVFIVRKSATDPSIIDSFNVGNTVQLGELSVAPVWEHIRRFMEADGPHLPPGESLNENKPPQTLWESWAEVGPVGPNYMATWKRYPFIMVVYHLLFPLFVPMFFFWGIFNWLSYKTAIPVAWPQEVMDAVK